MDRRFLKSRWLTWLSILLAFSLLAAACNDNSDDGDSDASDEQSEDAGPADTEVRLGIIG